MLTVVAALIESAGRLLVCQRRQGQSFELMWEFPGGKQEPGETSQQALARELREELAIEARIGEQIYRTCHHYPEMPEPLELLFFLATADLSRVQNLVFEQIQWREPYSLIELDFLPADRELIDGLAKGILRLPPPGPVGIR
jgi:8-oxo-dGTP diphosphatase